jgi:muramoyltetrapeptide carboxypeptidase
VIQSYLLKNDFASIHGQTIKTPSFGVSEESYTEIFDILEGKKLKYSVENINSTKKEKQKEN